MDDRARSYDERSPEEIRRDIEDNRRQMDETVDALGDRLSPGRILDEVWSRAKGGDAHALGDTLRDHPIPIALMGLGLGWLAVERTRGGPDGHDGAGTRARAEGRRGPYRGEAVDRDDPEWEHAGTAARAREKATGAAETVKNRLADAAGSTKEAASDLKETVGDGLSTARDAVAGAAHTAGAKASDAGRAVAHGASDAASTAARGARRGGEKISESFSSALEDHPLSLGAIAFGIGLAGGLAPPSTHWEQERMGRVSDALKDEVKHAGEETARKVARVAGDAAEAARDELRHQKEEGTTEAAVSEAADRLKSSAKEVAHAAEDAARKSAEQEDLTAEGVKRRAERVRDRTREVAKSGD